MPKKKPTSPKTPRPKPPQTGDWGPVRAIRGPYAGRVGYYDDDGDRQSECIVYFHRPFQDGYAIIPRRDLVIADKPALPLVRFLRANPYLAQQMGIVVDREADQTDAPPSPGA